MPRKKRDEAGERERVKERRRRILDAAAVVFARRGYHLARTREIAAEAGVAEGTIYNYYANKRDLLLAIIQQVTVESVPEMLTQTRAYHDARSWLKAVLRDRLAMLDRNRDLIRAVLPEMIADNDLQHEYLRQVIIPSIVKYLPLTQQVFQGTRLRRFNAGVIVPAIIGAAATAFLFSEWTNLPVGSPPSSEELVDELASFFLDGLLSRDQRPATSTAMT